jgi:hypothetical protein
MRTIVPAGMLALLFAATPASAMMCGGGQQARSSGNTATTGMMCGAGQTADDPMAEKPAQQQSSGMCPCCRNMAMMRGGMGRGTGSGSMGGGMQHHDMPGMDAPKN